MKKALPIYIITIAVFFLLIADSLCTTGMFMDGMIYSNVAANMAEGTCSFWHPTLSRGLFPEFYEHPPLAMGMLSLFYKVLGTSLWVTRVFCMFITVLTAYLILLIWRRLGYKWEMGWLPLFLWIMIPAVSLNSHNFMLECTMAIFDLGAVLCMIHSAGHTWKRVIWSLLAGILIFLAFLTKGFTGLYPLAFPLIVWLVEKIFALNYGDKTWNVSLPVALLYTLLPIISALLCFGIICFFYPQAHNFFDTYFHHQVVNGISARVVDSRFHILIKFFEQTAIVWAIFIIVLFVHRFIHINKTSAPGVLYAETVMEDLVGTTHKIQWSHRKWQYFLAFGLLTIVGVLPIMISLKQRSYYILTVYPFFVIAISALLNNIVENWLSIAGKKFHIITSSLALVLLLGAVILNVKYFGEPGREQIMQNDMRQVLPHLEYGEEVAMPYEMRTEYSLINYYYREKRVELYAYQPVFPQDTSSETSTTTNTQIDDKTAEKEKTDGKNTNSTSQSSTRVSSTSTTLTVKTIAALVANSHPEDDIVANKTKRPHSAAKDKGSNIEKSTSAKKTPTDSISTIPLPEPPDDLPLHILTNGTPMGKLAPYYQEIQLNTYQYKLYKRL